MAGSDGFFDARNAQAVLKHGILTRYAYYFAGRAGHATGGNVAFIDGYAGEGRYADGAPASPLLLATQAERAAFISRNVRLAYVEPDPTRRGRLRTTLKEAGIEPDVLAERNFEHEVDRLLTRYSNDAILLFVDPFGLGMHMDTLNYVLDSSTRQRPIDVLYHFSLLTVARMGRAALGEGNRSPNARHLDATLGPSVDWRGHLAGIAASSGAATRAALQIADAFATDIRDRTGVPSLSVQVRRRPSHQPTYLLTLFTKDPVGRALWDYADVAGNAYVRWLHHCDTEDYEANVSALDRNGVLTLFGEEPRSLDDVERDLRQQAVGYLVQHIQTVVARRRVFCPGDDIKATYGAFLGRARETHVRDALTTLVSEGRLSGDPTGAIRSKTYRWIDTDA